jgi:hypothetical protein
MLLDFIRAENGSRAAENHLPISRLGIPRHAMFPTGAQHASRRRGGVV